MAWFLWKDIKKNSQKKGVWLRVRAMLEDKDFCRAVNKAGLRPEYVRWIKVEHVKDGWALLECHGHSGWQGLVNAFRIRNWEKNKAKGKPFAGGMRKIAFVYAPENPEWVCEADLGRGLKE